MSDLPAAPCPAQAYKYQGYDYSAVFNPAYYADKYPDVKKAFGANEKALFNHFCLYGMKEGRLASADFNVNKYRESYADLKTPLEIIFPYIISIILYSEKRKEGKASDESSPIPWTASAYCLAHGSLSRVFPAAHII